MSCLKADTHDHAVHVLHRSHTSCKPIYRKYTSAWTRLRTCAALLLQLHVVNQILSVFAQTRRDRCADFHYVSKFKFVFGNLHLISAFKIMFSLHSHQPRFVIYFPKINLLRAKDASHIKSAAQRMHSTVMCTGLYIT